MLQLRVPSSNRPWQVLVPSGPGGKEVFVGSMLMFFPTHQDQELEFLKTSWGSWYRAANLKEYFGTPSRTPLNPLRIGKAPQETLPH